MNNIIIAAMGKNREIGSQGKIPWHLPNDLKRFQEITTGQTVIMGRKTFESIGKPLPFRQNIVVTRREGYSRTGYQIAHSLDEAIQLSKEPVYPFVIGGSEIYNLALSQTAFLFVTLIDSEFPNADSFFPPINPIIWMEIYKRYFPSDNQNKFDSTFVIYERNPTY